MEIKQKTKKRPIYKRKRTYIFLVLIFLFGYVYNFLDLRLSDTTFKRDLDENAFNYEAEFFYDKFENRIIRTVSIGNDSLPIFLFIHGSPSSSSIWSAYLKDSLLLSKGKLMAVDRPGYGYSDYGNIELSVQKQAEYVAKVVKKHKLNKQKVYVIASSYGGTVAARISMDYPDLIDGCLYIQSSFAPGLEHTYSISHFIKNDWVSWAIPSAILNANKEKLNHKKQLDEMVPLWSNIKNKSIILHGEEDKLIFPANAKFAYDRMVNALKVKLKFIKGIGHSIAWNKRDLVKQSILELVSW